MRKCSARNKYKIEYRVYYIRSIFKLADIIQSGGMAKWFLSENDIFINGEQDQRRGRKLRAGDKIKIPDLVSFTDYRLS